MDRGCWKCSPELINSVSVPAGRRESSGLQAEGANIGNQGSWRVLLCSGPYTVGFNSFPLPGRGVNVYYQDTRGAGLTNSRVTAHMEGEGAKTLQEI